MNELSLQQLWKSYHQLGEVAFRDELIVHHLHLVKWVVGRVASGLPNHIKLDDLYSSGIAGLIRAVEKYDPEKGGKFTTYAALLIKGAIIDELRELDWVPRSLHRKANQIALAQDHLQQKLGRDPTDEEISSHMGLTGSEYDELLEKVRPAILIPLNAEFVGGDEDSTPISEKIADERVETSFEVADRREYQTFVEEAIAALPEKERQVLMLYYYEELMLKEIGKILGISESRVSQIHTKALLKLRTKLRFLTKG